MGRRLTIVLIALLLAAAAAATAPAGALADGDPASDILLGQNVFYPYEPPVARALQDKLTAETAAAHRAGFPLKVAIIGSREDLGAIPSLFGKPQQYAEFLDREISFLGPQPVLIVMAADYGAAGVKPAVARAVEALPAPSGGTPDDLARAASTAVGKLASASGHPVSKSGPSGATSGGGDSQALLLFILIAAAVAVALLLLLLRSRELLMRARAQGGGRPPR